MKYSHAPDPGFMVPENEEIFLELTCQTCRTFLSVSDEMGFFTAVVSQQVLAKRGALINGYN